jgi:hypothetical protein
MTRHSTGLAIFLCLLGLAWYGATRVQAQDQALPWLTVGCDFADAVSSGDMSRVAALTTPEYQTYLTTALSGQPPRCGLSGRDFVQNGARFSAEYATVHLLCRHPNGVEEVVTVTVKLTNGAWKVSGGWTP